MPTRNQRCKNSLDLCLWGWRRQKLQECTVHDVSLTFYTNMSMAETTEVANIEPNNHSEPTKVGESGNFRTTSADHRVEVIAQSCCEINEHFGSLGFRTVQPRTLLKATEAVLDREP
jgi:hypothetical protein